MWHVIQKRSDRPGVLAAGWFYFDNVGSQITSIQAHKEALREVSRKLAAEHVVTAQLFSATHGVGVEEARQQIMALLQTTEST